MNVTSHWSIDWAVALFITTAITHDAITIFVCNQCKSFPPPPGYAVCRYKKIKEAKDISSKSAEDKRTIFGASASTSSAVAATTAADDSIQSSSIVVDVFQSIKYNMSTTAEWVDNDVMNDKDETDRASIKAKKKKSKKSKRERHE